MSGTVFLVVLLAALLHASWNALVKGGVDKSAGMLAVVAGQGLSGLVLLPFASPLDWSAWPYLVSGVLLHMGYQLFLMQSYKIGDLTQVYPIARGAAPLLVALGSATLLGASFGRIELLALLMMSVGIISVGLTRRADGLFQPKAALLALITGMFIAGYSLNDGVGARAAGTAVGFFGVLAVANAVATAAAAEAIRPGLLRRAARLWRLALIGGGASFLAYVLVVWAFTQAPIALVSALRETSIVFAVIIGITLLGERLDARKLVSISLTLAGAVLLRLVSGQGPG